MQIINAYCDRLLNFEVPLEDIFLENDVHPAIKNLFEVAYKSISKSDFSIKTIINSFQGTLTERFLLKDQLLELGYFSGDEASPGAYLWLIRHFLGLLPLPLLPMKTNDRRMPWNIFCALCAKFLDDHCYRSYSTFYYSVARYINRLPESNRMLLLNLLELFECLSGNPKDIEDLAEYFASAVFVRPYYPGNGIKYCRQGYYLLLFLMVHWNVLRSLCKTPEAFKIQVFKDEEVTFTKMIHTSLPLLKTENLYQKLLDLKNLRTQNYDKAIQTLSCSVISDGSVKVSRCSSTTTNINRESNIKKSKTSDTDEYFYDEDFKNRENSFNQQIGWTYTSSAPSTPQIGWNINKNDYNLSFDNNESDKKSEDEKKSSLVSLQNFFRKIRPSLCSIKKSNNNNNSSCSVKYKRMVSSRNNSF